MCCHTSPLWATGIASQDKVTSEPVFASGFLAPREVSEWEDKDHLPHLLWLRHSRDRWKGGVMGIFCLYTGNGKKLGWLCHQLEKLRRKAMLLNQNHPPHMPFHTSLLCPPLHNTSHLLSFLAYIDKRNYTFLKHFQYCIVIHFSCQVPPWKLTHLSRSQILRGEMCPQQAVPVTNELFKKTKKQTKNTY